MSSTLTDTVSPIDRISEGWLTCDHDSSEMWIRPSMPSRSTNAPKSTMLEIVPCRAWPGCGRSRIRSRSSLRCSSSTARRDSTTLLRLRLSSMTLHSIACPMYSSRLGTRRMSQSEAADAEVDDQAALDDLNHGAFDRLARLGGGFDALPGLLEPRALLGKDE